VLHGISPFFSGLGRELDGRARGVLVKRGTAELSCVLLLCDFPCPAVEKDADFENEVSVFF